MKNLATCSPSEFASQTLKFKDALAELLKAVNIQDIRKRKPDYIEIPENASEEDTRKIVATNKELLKKQALDNLNLLLERFLKENTEKTLEVLAYSCFVEPEEVDNYQMQDYLDCLMDMFESKAVRRFFLFTAQIQNQNIITF